MIPKAHHFHHVFTTFFHAGGGSFLCLHQRVLVICNVLPRQLGGVTSEAGLLVAQQGRVREAAAPPPAAPLGEAVDGERRGGEAGGWDPVALLWVGENYMGKSWGKLFGTFFGRKVLQVWTFFDFLCWNPLFFHAFSLQIEGESLELSLYGLFGNLLLNLICFAASISHLETFFNVQRMMICTY